MRRLIPLALALACACAAPAAASTTLGSINTSTSGTCTAGDVYWNFQSAAPSYATPAGGVITSFSVVGTGNAGNKAQLFLLHENTSGNVGDPWTVKGTSAMATLAGTGTETFATRVKADAGDVIALGSVDALSNCYFSAGSSDNAAVGTGTASSTGGTVTPTAPGSSIRVNISAVLEPDADGDGYGDETQDSCPADPAIHAGPCASDLSLSAATAPAAPLAGGVAAVAFTVKVAGAPANGVVIRPTLPAGLTLVSSYPACTDSCSIGHVDSGADATLVLLVSAAQAGSYTVSGLASSAQVEVNPADNDATAALAFASALGRFPACTVPSLKRLPLAFARRVLRAAGCTLGRVTRKKGRAGRRGTVIKQSAKVKTVLPVGSAVQVTVRK